MAPVDRVPPVEEWPSPNHGPRRDGLRPELIVLHFTAMQSFVAARDRLCDRAAEVSAHYLICRTGRILRLVPEARRAWHAGAGAWAGRDDVNSRSIGIELDNAGTHPFSEPQMAALEALLPGIMARHGISAAGVIGHSDLAPGRKVDPGPRFDWPRLARHGLALPTPPKPIAAAEGALEPAFRSAAAAAGYDPEVPLETLLATTRLRHAPARRGPLCAADLALPPL